MARVSRKNRKIEPVRSVALYNTAIYIRLSVEDSGTDNSETIETQEYMVEEYVARQSDMKLTSTFIDNGKSGTNFNRPAFISMMEQVKERKINCIVVKDLSRFARNYLDAENYIKTLFPYLGVRFVAINDNYDSNDLSKSDDLLYSIKNIVNGLVSKDTSSKVSAVTKQKQLAGEFIGSFAPYGYMKNPDKKNHLIVDPVTAPIAKEIFEMKKQEIGYVTIARKLNERNLPSPLLYNYQSGRYKIKQEPVGYKRMWNSRMVKQIVENFTYTGNVTQHKRIKSLCNGIPSTDLDKSEHYTVYGTHEAIIDVETFREIEKQNIETSKLYKDRNGKYPHTDNIFLKKIYCGDCGKALTRYKNVSNKGEIRYTYLCQNQAFHLHTGTCTLKNVDEKSLIFVIINCLKVYIDLALAIDKKLEKVKNSKAFKAKTRKFERELAKLEKQVEKNILHTSLLFENFTDNVIELEEYMRLNGEYQTEIETLLHKKTRVLEEKDRHEKLFSQNEWVTSLTNMTDTPVLTFETVSILIEKIVVSGYNDIEIFWKFKDSITSTINDIGGVK